jgi:hypothetical protein
VSAELAVFLTTWFVFATGLCAIVVIRHAAELHHLWLGMAAGILVYAFGWPWYVGLIALLVTLDDAVQHTVQLILWERAGKRGDPETYWHSPLNLLYGWALGVIDGL